MRVREGDEFQCQCGDCFVELRVTKACAEGTCGDGCDAELRCCGTEMRRKGPEKKSG
ncbi:MAG: hypothetical protein SCH98_07870 [Deferrisomatales bacterium]|nr:hypothetical protein [Deferrisomatales bacterium]